MPTKWPIYLVTFSSQYLASATFMRFTSHYEAPMSSFRGKTFGTEQFMDQYAEETGKFGFFEEWMEFNIPSSVLQPFYRGEFDPLTKKEQILLDLFRGIPEPFYVIGALEKDHRIIAHEFVHGLFATQPTYRECVLAELKELDSAPLRQMRKRMLKMGYCHAVLDDECNTYLVTGRCDKLRDKRLAAPSRKMAKVFEQQFGYDIQKTQNARVVLASVHHIRFNLLSTNPVSVDAGFS